MACPRILELSVGWSCHDVKNKCGFRVGFALQKHAYSNIQKISPLKTENFQIKNDIFHISSKT